MRPENQLHSKLQRKIFTPRTGDDENETMNENENPPSDSATGPAPEISGENQPPQVAVKRRSVRAKAKCIIEKCNRPAKTRGVCGSHYAMAIRSIAHGKTTDAQLVADGLLLPKTKAGRPCKSSNPYTPEA